MSYQFRIVSVALLLGLTACAAPRQLPVVPAEVQATQATQEPLRCVDVVVVTRPGFEARKVFGFIPPPQSDLRTIELSSKVEDMMNNLANDLRWRLSEANAGGVVSVSAKGYTPSTCRTHLVTVIPTEAAQGGGASPTATLRFTLYETKSKRQIWQSEATFVQGWAPGPLSQSLVTALQSLGMKNAPKAAVPLIISGLPKLGDSMDSIQATLGTTVQPRTIESGITNRRYTSLALPDRGVQLIFNEDNKLQRIVLRPPFFDAVRGIRIGDSRSTVLQVLGEPTGTYRSMELQPGLAYRSSEGSLGFEFELKGTVREIWVSK